MMDYLIFWDWLAFAARWLHVVTAIAWIGSSFYFIALDLGLRRHAQLPAGVNGEEWQVHGGGFYHIQKYMVAPPNMPEHLIWFKWESYATWLSGFALLCIVYYAGADLYLIDPNVLDVSPAVAILISLVSLSVGWLIYDLLCKSPLASNDTLLMLILYGVIVFMAWGYTNLFTGRAAFLHLGAFTATIMSANVFLLIIPNQKKVVADLIAGRTPDPKLGKQAKQRSTHNNYLTLPVLFLMLSNHYPLAHSTQFNWVIAALVFILGVLIRHYFNSRHAGTGNPHWTWLASAIIFIVIIWLSTVPKLLGGQEKISASAQALIEAPEFQQARDVVLGRCSMCHAAEPAWDGILLPPKGVRLDTDGGIATHAREIYLQAGVSHAMPPGNRTGMTEEERAQIVGWYRNATAGKLIQ
ncbi:urate hydroxylase PuuD [Phyllobacterium sp. 0TCS1.6C]|uniref:urate hydroxylase PuuD n=1 Tax=unclassified Phyllobacterium TaxID=2638441 RepID=UPI002264943F|nr:MULTISPECIES: urate hydroxylase PuuD [unclassified Phyllobacterium]MCX8279519.1 urate hydroxylase PuuD [Phyllobacterium sp. 0TCS1.6C]MCX8292290.1 urate hydroxylase PuuD [Phyllobacterium sp. 0TCS1.6A]